MKKGLKASVHFFNVGHGDSIVIEVKPEEKESEYIVIDSNLIKIEDKSINPSFEFLKDKKAKKISALIISHLHNDHYSGVECFFNNFQIKKLIIPPLISTDSEILKKIIKNYLAKAQEALDISDDDSVTENIDSLVSLIQFNIDNDEKVEEGIGPENNIRFPGLDGIEGTIYLPFPRIRNVLHKKIIDGNFRLDWFPAMNDSSIAISFEFENSKFLFSGDSTRRQWLNHIRHMQRDGITNLNIQFLKAPHHGSRDNNNATLFEYWFENSESEKYIFVSANGKSHPHSEFFGLVKKYNLNPYCTNLSRHCIAESDSDTSSGIPDLIREAISKYDIETLPIPCQGMISVHLDPKPRIESSPNCLPCIYRPKLESSP